MADEFSPTISPDGDWIAYASDETGQTEVYAQSFPELDRKVPISAGPGSHPLWSIDGGSVFFESPVGMMKAPVQLGSRLQVSSAEVLFEELYYGAFTNPFRQYDLSLDGEQFLVLRSGAASVEPILEQNWFEELKRLVPVN